MAPLGAARFGLLGGEEVEDLGKLELITTETASSVYSVDILSISETTYRFHLLTLSDITVSANGNSVVLRFWYGGTPTLATSYITAGTSINESQTVANLGNLTDNAVGVRNVGTDTGQSGGASIWLYAAGVLAEDTFTNFHNVSQNSSDLTFTQYGGNWLDLTTNVNGIRIFTSTGHTFSGNISLYGYSESSS